MPVLACGLLLLLSGLPCLASAGDIECSEEGGEFTVTVEGIPELQNIRVIKVKDSKMTRLPSGEYAETGGRYKVVRVVDGREEVLGYVERGMGAHITHWEHKCEVCGNRYWPERLPPWARNNTMGYWHHSEVCGAVKSLLTHHVEAHVQGGTE